MKSCITLMLAACILCALTVESRDVYVAAPNTLRVGTEEKIAVAIDGVNNRELLEIYVQDYPGRKRNLTQTDVAVAPEKPEIASLLIEQEDVFDMDLMDPKANFYVSLVVHGSGFHKEAVIPLSIKSGYVFLQTDKPIYTPKQKVKFRVIAFDDEAKPTIDKIRMQIRNPKNVVVRDTAYDKTLLDSSKFFITPEPFAFSSHPLLGQWTATVLYGHMFQQNVSAAFDVEEYVLPTFTVKLDVREVILPSATIIPVSVTAKYLYGKPVVGFVTFRFGIQGEAPEATFFGKIDSEELDNGKASIRVNTSYIKQHEFVHWFPEGSRFIVEASVTESATGQKEVAIDKKGIFTSTPLVISFQRCLKDFKPGLTSVIEADVKHVSGHPAKGIRTILTGNANGNMPLRIYTNESTSDEAGRIWFGIHPEEHHNTVQVEVKTLDPKFKDNQAVGHHEQKKFESNNKAYIAINRRSRETIQPGTSFSEDIYIQNGGHLMTHIYFLVTSRGKIILMEKLPRGQFANRRVEFQVTYQMTPSFRIVVFGHCNGELIADSRRVDVANECHPKANVAVETEFLAKEPGSNLKITLRGSKGTTVGLLGVDSGVYALSDQGLLTRPKMFKTLDSHDLGCGPGGGWTTNGVLGNAGILIISNHYSPPADLASSCKEIIRRKRHIASVKLQEFIGKARSCCALGMSKDKYSRNCEKRANVVKDRLMEKDRLIEDDKNCSEIFLECCIHKENSKMYFLNLVAPKPGSVATQRIAQNYGDLLEVAEEEEEEMESNINVRNEFRETWIFNDFILGPDGQAEHHLSLPHSITTWIIQAVSLSPENGMCVIPPTEVVSFKKVFIQLSLPYSVVRNEQIEIKATVFNYGSNTIKVEVYMFGVKDLCSTYQEGEKSERKRFAITPHSANTVGFPVIPLKAGTYLIKVAARSSEGSDIVQKELLVVPEGKTVEKHITIPLDPSNQQKRAKRDLQTQFYSDSIDETQNLQVTAIPLKIPDESIPGTDVCIVSAMGDQFGPTVETSLENPDSLLSGPSGCAEQNMVHFAPTLYTMRYLKSVGEITAEKEAKGYDLIRKGYGHQLTFRKEDGSFGAWIHTPSSVWLTAFVTKVFCQASELVYIDTDVMCKGVLWLLSKQKPDGAFEEDNPVYHKDLMGGVKGKGPLTAYVLLTLEACRCDIAVNVPKAKAVQYLAENLGTINEPLPIAITAYALALVESELKNAAKTKLLALKNYDGDSNTLHWGSGTAAANIETTSYALLILLQFKDMEKCNSIVNWLNTQRYFSGRFESTQDTIVALHALSEYAIKAKSPGISLVSNITLNNDRTFLKTVSFDERNAQILQEVKVDKLGGMLFVNTAGHGVGLLSVKLRYNVPIPPEKLCRFDISVDVSNVKEKRPNQAPVIINHQNKNTFVLHPDDLIRGAKEALEEEPEEVIYEIDPRRRNRRIPRIGIALADFQRSQRKKREEKQENSVVVHKVKICVRYRGDREAGMSIVNVGVFSGFIPNEKDLKKLQNDPNTLIDRYEISERGVVFYLGKVSHIQPHCFEFQITQGYTVGNTQPSAIEVYDYYDPEESCTLFYRPDNNSPILRHLCSNGICQCAEGGCPPEKPFADISAENRDKLFRSACEEHDYVWKGKVISRVERKSGFLRVKFLVQEVFKEGIEVADVVEKEERLLLARDNCRSAELFKDLEYIIMGKDGEKYENEDGEMRYRYMLDRSTKIQTWHNFKTADGKGKDKLLQRTLNWLRTKLKDDGCDL